MVVLKVSYLMHDYVLMHTYVSAVMPHVITFCLG